MMSDVCVQRRREFGGILLAALLPFCAWPDAFDEGFRDPPREFGLQAWYHWVGDYATEKGLAADISAMADFGICSAHIFGPGHCPLPGKEVPGSDLLNAEFGFCKMIHYCICFDR